MEHTPHSPLEEAAAHAPRGVTREHLKREGRHHGVRLRAPCRHQPPGSSASKSATGGAVSVAAWTAPPMLAGGGGTAAVMT
eukprot:SAG25_NODE_4957_length_724_cov_2.148800_1_plen_80_part_10